MSLKSLFSAAVLAVGSLFVTGTADAQSWFAPSYSTCPNGNCNLARPNYYTSAYGAPLTYSSCPNGNCALGSCANGKCTTGMCPNGQCTTGMCPNGQCTNGYRVPVSPSYSAYNRFPSVSSYSNDWNHHTFPHTSRMYNDSPFYR